MIWRGSAVHVAGIRKRWIGRWIRWIEISRKSWIRRAVRRWIRWRKVDKKVGKVKKGG